MSPTTIYDLSACSCCGGGEETHECEKSTQELPETATVNIGGIGELGCGNCDTWNAEWELPADGACEYLLSTLVAADHPNYVASLPCGADYIRLHIVAVEYPPDVDLGDPVYWFWELEIVGGSIGRFFWRGPPQSEYPLPFPARGTWTLEFYGADKPPGFNSSADNGCAYSTADDATAVV